MTISTALKQDAWSANSDLPFVLLKAEHPDLTSPVRVVNNRIDVTSNGEIFTAFPFEIVLPDSSEGSAPRCKVRIDNVSREIGQIIRSISSAVTISIYVVRHDTPDVIEVSFEGMTAGSVNYDSLSVEIELSYEDLFREPYPAHEFSPAEYPGLIR